jgi:histidinol dehydrogenase
MNSDLESSCMARFFSPLGAREFHQASHAVEATHKGLAALSRDAIALAEGEAEGLAAHAEPVRRRVDSDGK